MDNFVSRSELLPADRSAVRASAPVQGVRPVNGSRFNAESGRDQGASNAGRDTAQREEQIATLAEYVEVHARISEILADLGSGATNFDEAVGATEAIMPRPIILVPLPPASKEAVEHAADLARRIVARAGHAHAAQATISRSAADQLLAANGQAGA
ncbi:hypothetical protein J3E64_003301 [Sphingobium sp. OAS761]|uniref:hypothetical protein n=1 Tax=Sphingobium sp. OAS761 TaxID=2817901 RepID=UPI0020A0A76E|nr:hypothetical protein [Sphingobium sp. OAS761]MCP1471590.1 hypothetical protein [Sphingobium sp. OAS761]